MQHEGAVAQVHGLGRQSLGAAAGRHDPATGAKTSVGHDPNDQLDRLGSDPRLASHGTTKPPNPRAVGAGAAS